MRFPRTLHLDAAGVETLDPAASPGEWAVSGAFVFSDREPALLMGADLQAFRSGFIGIGSFGWSALVTVQEIGPAEYERAVEALADHLIERYRAPDRASARALAEEECKFAQSICDRPIGTLVAVEREFGPQGIVERFRTVEPPQSRPQELGGR